MARVLTDREIAVTREAQTLMSQLGSPSLVPDGWWGSYTQRAYNALAPEARAAVDSMLATSGLSAQRLATAFAAEKLSDPKTKATFAVSRASMLVARRDMVELVKRVAIAENVPVTTALKICWLESKFDPKARSGTGAKGLFQFTTIATKDVVERGGYNLAGREYEPEPNAIAGMKFIKLVARDLGVSLNDVASVYMGFNIGPTAARLYQSGHLTDSVRTAISHQAYGKPEEYGARLAAAVQDAPVLA